MLPQLKAERQLAAIEAASVPYMSETGHRATLDKYTQILDQEQRPRRATLGDLARMGINVRTVPKKEPAGG